jgi:hypothetical protein
MNAFENLGYAASNELAPDAWKDYMLGNLDKQDQYQQERLNQYVALQERARAKRIRQNQIAGMKSSFNAALSAFGGASAGASIIGGTELTDQMQTSLEPTNVLDQSAPSFTDFMKQKQPNWNQLFSSDEFMRNQ